MDCLSFIAQSTFRHFLCNYYIPGNKLREDRPPRPSPGPASGRGSNGEQPGPRGSERGDRAPPRVSRGRSSAPVGTGEEPGFPRVS